jgi:hypothetical protein
MRPLAKNDPLRGYATRPQEWRTGLCLLEEGGPVAGFDDHRWARFIATSRWFLDEWSVRADSLGWTTLDLFGAHPVAPAARLECAGLLILLGSATVHGVDRRGADILTGPVFPLRYRRPCWVMIQSTENCLKEHLAE